MTIQLTPKSFNHIIIFFFLLLLSASVFSIFCVAQPCASNPEETTRCPPFRSIPPFPFSSIPGCGHPFFHLNCSSPNFSSIFINNISFSLLHFELLNSTSFILALSPQISSFSSGRISTSNCSSHLSDIPSRSINLSAGSRLSLVRSYSPPNNLPNCTQCPWECNLLNNPLELLNECGSTHTHPHPHPPLSPLHRCQTDILPYINNLLKVGFQVHYDASQDSYFSSCTHCRSNNGICGFNSSDPHQHFICFPRSKTTVLGNNPNRAVVLCAIFVLLCLLLFILGFAAIYRSRRLKLLTTEDPTTLFLHRYRSATPLPPIFTYEELQFSTNQFDPKRKIGDGGFGSVYLGQLYDGRIVAVKYLHHYATVKSFCNEILILSSIHHPNLVKLHGYCSGPKGKFLVYDYVRNGTLADHLHTQNRKRALTWQLRLHIALQTALAMEYLHFSVQPPIVHRDITSSNIFVEKDMRVKVGDFGLSRLLVFPEKSSSDFVWTGPQGTPGYLDPDYHRSFMLTEKSDVYSFGVVLLELLSGLKAMDQNRDKREMALADLAVSRIQTGKLNQLVDPILVIHGGGVMEEVHAVAELAFRCVAADKDDRPNSKEVVAELKRIRRL